jgi:tetratricopeptide (TPR) repeat protein
MQMMGAANQNLFVSRDEGKFKIVGDGNDSAELGNYALYLVANHRQTEARAMLDWKRDLVHRGGGDDPLEGNLFARFWTSGSESNSIPLAALALTLQKPDSKTPLAPAVTAYAASPGDVDLTLLLACAYANRHDAANTQLYLDKLLAKYPDSITAITMQGTLYDQTRDYTAWRALLDRRLAKRPADHDLLSQAAYEAQSEHDFARARATLQKLIDSGKATDNDFNSIAWLGLFDDHADAKSIEAGQQAVTLSKSGSFADLHTLACLYAAAGKTTEARELLLKAMAVSYVSEPNSEVWFGFGSIYEQFGADDAAIAAYRKVDKPDSTFIGATATWNLAQAHLRSLHAN